MKIDEAVCRDAAFDVLLARTLAAGRRTDVAAAVRADHPRPARQNLLQTLAIVAGIAVVVLTAWRSSLPASPVQDPQRPLREIALQDAEHLRRLADDVHDAFAQFVQVVTIRFPIGRQFGQQVDFVEVPDARIEVANGAALARELATAFARPRDASASHQDALLDLHLPVDDDRCIVVRCHRAGGKVSISTVGLGLRHVDGELANRVREWMSRAKEAAAPTFVFAKTAPDLRNAPETVTQLLGYGVDDEALRATKHMPLLQRVRLVGRHTDEYPQDYVGVELSATGLAELAACPRITHLHLESAVLDDRALGIVAGFADLRELVIDDGRRCTFGRGGIALLANLPRLRSLHIDGCDGLTDSALAALARSRTLTEVRLVDCNRVSGRGIRALLGATALRRLELVRVDVSGDDDEIDTDASGLRELELVKCTGRFSAWEVTPNIARLSLSDQSLDAGEIESLCRLPLRELTISRCPGAAPHLERLAALPRLESLAILGMRAGADWPSTFAKLRHAESLRRLSLVQNGLADDHAVHLRHLQQLDRLDLRYNQIRPERLDELRHWLPGVAVFGDDSRAGPK